MDPTTRPSLLLRMRNHRDGVAWGEFVAVYEPVVYRLARRRGLQDADAREVVQEVLLAVSTAIDRFDPRRNGSFRGWLATVTRHATIDRLRRESRQIPPGGHSDVQYHVAELIGDEAASGEVDEFERERRQQLFRWAASEVRRRTSEVNWTAFWRSAVEGCPPAEVAADLRMDVGAVYVARCRAIDRIRRLVRDRWEE